MESPHPYIDRSAAKPNSSTERSAIDSSIILQLRRVSEDELAAMITPDMRQGFLDELARDRSE